MVLYKAPRASTVAKVYLGLAVTGLGSCQGSGGQGSSGPGMRLAIAGESVSGGYAQPCVPYGGERVSVTATRVGRVITASVTDPKIVGARATMGMPTRVSQNNRVFDSVAGFRLAQVAR